MAITPLLEAIGANPSLGKRELLRSIMKNVDGPKLEEQAHRRVDEVFPTDSFAEEAKGVLWVLDRCPATQRAVASHIMEKTADDKRKGIKVLRRIADEAGTSKGLQA
jgi:hypothetical protein